MVVSLHSYDIILVASTYYVFLYCQKNLFLCHHIISSIPYMALNKTNRLHIEKIIFCVSTCYVYSLVHFYLIIFSFFLE